MPPPLLRFDHTLPHDPAIDAWLATLPAPLAALAREWFTVLRRCGDEVSELFHDGCANACFGDVPFAYVAVFTAHVNVGFFQGASLPDPARLLQGTGRSMRHIKLRSHVPVEASAIHALIQSAYAHIKSRVENG